MKRISLKTFRWLMFSMLLHNSFSSFSQDSPEYFQPLQHNPSLAGTDSIRSSFNYNSSFTDDDVGGDLMSFSYDQKLGNSNSGLGFVFNYLNNNLYDGFEKSIAGVYSHQFNFNKLIIRPAIEVEYFKSRYLINWGYNMYQRSIRNNWGIHSSLLIGYRSFRVSVVMHRINKPVLADFGDGYIIKSPLNFNARLSFKIRGVGWYENTYFAPEIQTAFIRREYSDGGSFYNYVISPGIHLRVKKFVGGMQINVGNGYRQINSNFSFCYNFRKFKTGIIWYPGDGYYSYYSVARVSLFCRLIIGREEYTGYEY